MSNLTLGTVALDDAHPHHLLDALRNIAGPNVGFGTLLNQIIALNNAAADRAPAAATITIGGTAHAGDVITATIGGHAVTYTVAALGTAASQTLTVGGTFHAGDQLVINVNGYTYIYAVQAGDTNLNGVATSIAAMLNANPEFSALYSASANAAVVTVAAKAVGTAFNGQLVQAGAIATTGVTTTLTAGGAALASGAAGDSLANIAANLAAAINADAAAKLLVSASASGAVVSLSAKHKGPDFNSTTLTAAVTGAGATTTATAQAATFGAATAGSGVADIVAISAGVRG